MDHINISLEEVREASQALRSINQNMYDLLNEMRQQIINLQHDWQSPSGEEIVQRFQQFSRRFEEEQQQIEVYARFLDMTVSSYGSIESSLHANASDMQV